MIITANEYKEMGFDATDEALLEKCIKRAEFVLNGISGGRASAIALGATPAADFVKQAADIVTVLHEGKILMEGNISDVLADKTVQAVYLGRGAE